MNHQLDTRKIQTNAPAAELRAAMAEEILGSYRGKTVLVLGIGGGGDVVGALPTCFDLERLGATVIPGGLTWKREVHDALARPRPLSRFKNVTVFNELIGEANEHTVPIDSRQHIEAHVSRALGGRPVAMLDITPGSAAVKEALLDYQRRRGIDAVIGVDAGGDVLCFGDEPTLQSPICDQTVLSAFATLPGALLGVFGFGGDGEMTLDAFHRRFAQLCNLKAFLGGLPIAVQDFPTMAHVLQEAPTEASRLPFEHATQLDAARRTNLIHFLTPTQPDIHQAIGTPRLLPMRDGSRTASLSDISAATLFFDPRAVFASSKFSTLCQTGLSIDQLALQFAQAGIDTEFGERNRNAGKK